MVRAAPRDAWVVGGCTWQLRCPIFIFCRFLGPGRPWGPGVRLGRILGGPSIEPFLGDGRDSAWEEQGTGASRTQKHSEAGYGWPVDRGAWTTKTVKRPRQQPAQAHPQYANYWAPLTRKRHTMPHSAQPKHTNYWAPRTRKRHQQEHRLGWFVCPGVGERGLSFPRGAIEGHTEG